MSIINGLKRNVMKANLNGMEFVKVTNIGKNNELINASIYLKVNDRYKAVYPNELPSQIVNRLAMDNTYTKMSEIEITKFLKVLKSTKEEIKEQNQFRELEYLLVDNMIDVNYVLFKDYGCNYYVLEGIKVNEFSMIEHNKIVPSNELPYVLMNIIETDKEFKNKTFLLENNIFAHVHRDNNKYLCTIMQFNPEGSKNELDKHSGVASVQVLGMFTLINTNNKYDFIVDQNDTSFFALSNEKIENIVQEFLDVIGLQKIEMID